MGSGTPLLNDYKREFVWKRFPQTVLGGPKLRLGYDAPAYVYINQVILFVIPWLVGGIFTSFAHYQILQDYIAAIICGTVAVIYVLIVQIIATVAQRKKSSVQPAATNTPNILAEDDEIAFSSCVAIETIEFVAPAKKFKVNIVLHALLSGPVCGLAMLYLLPNTLGALYSNTAATVILFIFGWITVCIAQYSLTVGAPPETATFRALDTWEIAPLSRPFYILVFAAFDLLARYYSEFVPVNYALHIVFIFLPLFWTIGLLPPLDALFLWLLEQALVILYGGSPMATDLRLIVMIILSTGVYLAAYFVPQGLGTIIIISCCGYLLSIDLGGFGAQLFDLCAKKTKEEPGNKNTGFLWKWAVKEVLFHIVMLCLAVGIATVIYYFAAQIGASMADYIAYGIMGLLVLEVLLAEMQTVYVFFGLLRNMLYPSSVQRTTIFKKGKRRLRALGYIRRVIMDWLAPLVMLVYLSLSITPTFSSSSSTTSSFNTTSTAASMLGWTRAFRWVWQSTQNSLLEITVIQIVKLAVSSPVAGWQSLGVGLQLLIVSLCRDRFRDLLNKLYLFFITLITSWSDKKQRRGSTIPTIVVTIILFPVVFGVIGVAVALSAPLLPLFTLPVFLIGYPRPLRSWPHAVGASANACEDTVFYKHAAPELARLLREGYSTGSLGEPAPGKQYLMRFQDRMAWVLVLERGYCYCTISIKGLELQETSCHTVEATRIEDFFEITFEVENGVKCCQFTKYPGNTLRPYDAGLIKTYSDAKNVLTGIIDSPDSLEKVASSFVQSLTWLLLRHCAQVKKSSSMLTSTSSSKQNFQHQELKNMSPSHIGTKETALDNDEDQQTWETMSIRPSSPNSVLQVKPAQRTLSVRSIPTSVWSEDNESLLMEPMDKKETDKINLVAGFASRHMNAKKSTSPSDDQHTVTVMSGVTDSTVTKLSDKDDLFEDLDLGLPAVDLSQKNQANQWTQPNPLFSHPKTVNNTAEKLFTELGGTVDLRSPHSSKLSLPLKWREIPVHPEVLNPLVGQFSKEWYQHVLTVLDLGTEADKVAEVLGNITQDEVLLDIYTRLVMACYAVVNVLGHSSTDVVSLGPSHVYKVYTGDIPWSTASEWITEDSELKEIVIKAYRYAVKLTIDQMLLGDASDHEELQQYLQEYDTEWYIGSEKDKDWTQAVLHGKPSLFSMGHDTVKSTYSSRTLTCQDVETFVGTLNPEAVRGQWANLSVELLYMTNDDEERYSIQAHPTLLRNLTVQSADPPLGYPIFASKPISIPTL